VELSKTSKGRPKKFSREFVDEIRRLILDEGYTRKSVGGKFDISQAVVKKMCEGTYFD